MTSQELKEYIVDNNKVEFILENLGCHSIEFHPNKNYYSATQPNGGDNLMGVVIKNNCYLNYYSYSRNIHIDEKKDIFFLIQEVKGFTFGETMKYVHDLFGLKYTFKKEEKLEATKFDPLEIFKRAANKKKSRNVLDLKFESLDESILTDFVPMIHIKLYREGIMPWTVKKFKLGYSYKWKRTIFPHRYWATGELMGYNARTSVENYREFEIKKYYITQGMDKSINLYGLWENHDSILKAGYVIVYEAEKSVLKRHSLLDETGVAISGHSLSEEQVRILIGLNVDIIISMDTDVDIQEVRNMCEHFRNIRNVYYTWDKYKLLPPKSSIADAKNQLFEYLMKYKIKYDDKEHELFLKGLEKK